MTQAASSGSSFRIDHQATRLAIEQQGQPRLVRLTVALADHLRDAHQTPGCTAVFVLKNKRTILAFSATGSSNYAVAFDPCDDNITSAIGRPLASTKSNTAGLQDLLRAGCG